MANGRTMFAQLSEGPRDGNARMFSPGRGARNWTSRSSPLHALNQWLRRRPGPPRCAGGRSRSSDGDFLAEYGQVRVRLAAMVGLVVEQADQASAGSIAAATPCVCRSPSCRWKRPARIRCAQQARSRWTMRLILCARARPWVSRIRCTACRSRGAWRVPLAVKRLSQMRSVASRWLERAAHRLEERADVLPSNSGLGSSPGGLVPVLLGWPWRLQAANIVKCCFKDFLQQLSFS